MRKLQGAIAAYRHRQARRAQEKLQREPSRVWREGRLARNQSEEKEEAERRFLSEQRFEVEQKIRHARDLERYRRMKEAEALRREEERREDEERLAKFRQEKRRVAALERMGFAQEEMQLKAREEARVAREALERQRFAEEEERREREAEMSRKHEAELREREEKQLQKLMRKTGTVPGQQPKKKPKETHQTISQRLLVRFHHEIDADVDAETMTFNVKPLADYIRSFPGATDHARHFSQFFGHAIRELKGRRLGEEGGLALCTGACNNVRRLDLSWNDLRFKGISSICSALERPHLLEHLQVVTLRGNNIDDTCLRRIAEALESVGSHCNMTELDVSCNAIRDAGAKRLAHALFRHAPRIKKVNLQGNRIGDKGAKTMASVVHTRTQRKGLSSLACLCLHRNSISARCVERLTRCTYYQSFLVI